MLKNIFFPLVILVSGCSQPDCQTIYEDPKSGVRVCMKEGWKIGEEPFANFTIEKDSLRVKVIGELPSSDPPYVPEKIWKSQFGMLAAFNNPCVALEGDHAIDVDGAHGWIGTAHIIKTGQHPEFFETFAMVIHNGRQYFIDSRCGSGDRKKNEKLVEEVCASIQLGSR